MITLFTSIEVCECLQAVTVGLVTSNFFFSQSEKGEDRMTEAAEDDEELREMREDDC